MVIQPPSVSSHASGSIKPKTGFRADLKALPGSSKRAPKFMQAGHQVIRASDPALVDYEEATGQSSIISRATAGGNEEDTSKSPARYSWLKSVETKTLLQ